jgi:membrane-associated protease RseP (regulator of RpoE activity)
VSSSAREWARSVALFLATIASTTWAGAELEGLEPWASLENFVAGLPFSLSLMSILVAHEMGHYLVGRGRGVDLSPPLFIPVPFLVMGTLGAVIDLRRPIRDRQTLLEVGAAGPLAGLVVALPILAWGIASSPVAPTDPDGAMFEGHSILYEAILWALKGPIPEGADIQLTSVAFAGWAGLLVTMMNLLPFGQLDGGHIAYALWGPTQVRNSKLVLLSLPVIAIATGVYYFLETGRWTSALSGIHWLLWAAVLTMMSRWAGDPVTLEGSPLSRLHRVGGLGMMVLFGLLFMPRWLWVGP